MHRCVVCLGSNYHSNEYMNHAREMLNNSFPGIRFASVQMTIPYDFKNPSMFCNQVATFTTKLEEEDLKLHIKNIERVCGRLPEDKRNEIVRIDIDLILFDEHIHKTEDYNRFYVQNGIRELNASIYKPAK